MEFFSSFGRKSLHSSVELDEFRGKDKWKQCMGKCPESGP